MRKFFLVIVLIGAAFLGGAFVNGPGLQWAQTQILGTLGFSADGEIASVDLKDPKESGPAAGRTKPAAAKSKRGAAGFDEPLAPVPTVVAETAAPDSSVKKSKPGSRSGLPDSGEIAPVMLPAAKANPKTSQKSLAGPDLELLPPLAAAPPATPLADRNVTTTADRGKSDPGPAEPRLPTPDPGPSPVPLDSLASFLPPSGLGPAAEPAAKDKSPATLPLAPGGDQSLPSPPLPGGSSGGRNEWTDLARKMQSLGVTRFSVDGEPNGRVVFSCLIPLAGKQAVSQRFEADGDDLFQAVQATLRRIALWRAAQPADTP